MPKFIEFCHIGIAKKNYLRTLNYINTQKNYT
jgi:hypothetical protein